MSAYSELISLVNDIRLDFDRGKGTLGEVTGRALGIMGRINLEITYPYCPVCQGDDRLKHPMVGGEVQLCRHPWHTPREYPSGELMCSTLGCPGDPHYSAPGRGHLPGCEHPR